MKYQRQQALERIREFLVANTRDEETTCCAAARLGIFCHGYDQWSTEQLNAMYPWLAQKLPPDAPRAELLKLIMAWDGARTLVHRAVTTCDAKSADQEACLGFAGFNNDELKEKFPQLFKLEDEITQW